MCVERKEIAAMIEEGAKRTEKSIVARLVGIKRDTNTIKQHVEKINGRLVAVEKTTRDLEEGGRRKELDCPFRDVIQTLAENQLTESALKEYINQQEEKNEKVSIKNARKLRNMGIILTALFSIISFAINYVL